ncbi:GpE family phage tail protein [Chitinimonas sp. BJB300]|nr:GpE family phage tail protein [Chitinimonas sp. BJB300]PHV11308.1 GpE family phage tail protein [Chitinimonas sp. BJB300]TSJ88201.1 GpE family phage tail protein [Chitinimonas sp. BJB300]
MADIAVVFHWQPDVMGEWVVSELADWRERARVRREVED